jgi:hypothetical protein
MEIHEERSDRLAFEFNRERAFGRKKFTPLAELSDHPVLDDHGGFFDWRTAIAWYQESSGNKRDVSLRAPLRVRGSRAVSATAGQQEAQGCSVQTIHL